MFWYTNDSKFIWLYLCIHFNIYIYHIKSTYFICKFNDQSEVLLKNSTLYSTLIDSCLSRTPEYTNKTVRPKFFGAFGLIIANNLARVRLGCILWPSYTLQHMSVFNAIPNRLLLFKQGGVEQHITRCSCQNGLKAVNRHENDSKLDG